MQQSVSVDKVAVAKKPNKAIVNRLIEYNDDLLQEIHETEETVRGNLSYKISTLDIDIATELVMVGVYGKEIKEAEEREQFLKRLLFLCPRRKKKSEHGITDEDIARARLYPIKELVKVRNKLTHCLWHDDHKPSMHVYPDHAYCFVCQKLADAIDFTMHMQGKDFVGAVRFLNGV